MQRHPRCVAGLHRAQRAPTVVTRVAAALRHPVFDILRRSEEARERCGEALVDHSERDGLDQPGDLVVAVAAVDGAPGECRCRVQDALIK
jgi:hypothetical protein